ncbi:hypothetical protein [Sphingomonas cavernae]|uniref:Uncharacterized protein n=1 Tax=Sphingomonas cavernae TaxID=2320861 RepID=A0A418WN87_9SPHN|nr:hypothetical protein [Sphingomonas cavernae]RJF91461.1 hypothetical protein D3876_08535 [Sphingomonas cavernae]
MTVLDKVRALIERLSPESICDDCITERLDLSATSQGNRKSRELAGADGFERHIDVCALCKRRKTVIRHIPG